MDTPRPQAAIYQLNDQLCLRSLADAPILEATERLAPAGCAIYEWSEYVIEWSEGAEARAPVQVGGLPVGASKRVGNSCILSFQNQLGLAALEVAAGEASCTLVVEVLSKKFPSVEAHTRFFSPLVQQLSERAAALPFAVSAPTALRSRESLRPRSDLFTWHFIRRERDSILAALRVVCHEPRHLLSSEDLYVPIELITSVEPGLLLEAIARPDKLVAVGPGSPAYAWSLTRAFRHAESGGQFLPIELRETRAVETLDTPEHRFVRAFVEELMNASHRLEARQGLAEHDLGDLLAFRGELEQALRSTFLSEVGPMTVFPSSSHILQQAYGYRDLLEAWRAFQLSADPFDDLQKALDVRDVATLYEWWCFFELVDQISELLRSPANPRLRVDDFGGLTRGIRAEFDGGWELLYNRTFSGRSGPWRSYSVPLRPDFVLAGAGEPLVGLDAKFRFDMSDWNLASEAGDGDGGWASKLETAGETPLRLAKQADIYKMHTYRDALGLRCSLVLYPGDQAIFYDVRGEQKDGLSLRDLLEGSIPEGVGSIPLTPEIRDD